MRKRRKREVLRIRAAGLNMSAARRTAKANMALESLEKRILAIQGEIDKLRKEIADLRTIVGLHDEIITEARR